MKFRDWDEERELDEAMGFVQKLDFQSKKKPKKSSSRNKITRDVNAPKDIKKAVETFVKGLDKVMKDWYKKMDYKNLELPTHEVSKGGRYYKVWRLDGPSKSIVAFIDTKEDFLGSIYKPASYRAPAKGIRGNVFSPQSGMEAINPHGLVIYWR